MTSTKKIIENKADSEENLLTPRFYTTNFKLELTSSSAISLKLGSAGEFIGKAEAEGKALL